MMGGANEMRIFIGMDFKISMTTLVVEDVINGSFHSIEQLNFN